jgi:hypothetical protein
MDNFQNVVGNYVVVVKRVIRLRSNICVHMGRGFWIFESSFLLVSGYAFLKTMGPIARLSVIRFILHCKFPICYEPNCILSSILWY